MFFPLCLGFRTHPLPLRYNKVYILIYRKIIQVNGSKGHENSLSYVKDIVRSISFKSYYSGFGFRLGLLGLYSGSYMVLWDDVGLWYKYILCRFVVIFIFKNYISKCSHQVDPTSSSTPITTFTYWSDNSVQNQFYPLQRQAFYEDKQADI